MTVRLTDFPKQPRLIRNWTGTHSPNEAAPSHQFGMQPSVDTKQPVQMTNPAVSLMTKSALLATESKTDLKHRWQLRVAAHTFWLQTNSVPKLPLPSMLFEHLFPRAGAHAQNFIKSFPGLHKEHTPSLEHTQHALLQHWFDFLSSQKSATSCSCDQKLPTAAQRGILQQRFTKMQFAFSAN